MNKGSRQPEDFIVPLNMNGLRGRMLHMPAPKGKKREILFVYGHHASLERIFGVAEYLNGFGAVTIPDLPGFGGMESFYKIGRKPTLDNMADYLASFIKLRYKNKKFTLAGLSLGFMVVARMLQKYPEIAKQVNLLISFAGLVNHKDFKFKRRIFYTFRYGSSFFSRRLPAAFVQKVVLRSFFIRFAYWAIEPLFIKEHHSKMTNAQKEERDKRIEFEIKLWQCNDVRTYMDMGVTMFTLDLTGSHVDLPVHHIVVDSDRYFDNARVEEHLQQIFKDCHMIKTKASQHSPSTVATAKEAAHFIPAEIKKLLTQDSN